MSSRPRAARAGSWMAGAAMTLCAACASVPPQQLAFAPVASGDFVGRPLPCTGGADAALASDEAGESLPGPLLRILSWNIHKNADPGWDAALAGFAAESDLLLIQEAALTSDLRSLLAAAGHAQWTLAGSWGQGGTETGVLSSARVAPLAACVQRTFEPLLQLPKAALITRYAMQDADAVLAVANLHSINFTLGLAEYQDQLDAVVGELAGHRGPVIVAGDFNTWSEGRLQAMQAAMRTLGLQAVLPLADLRTLVLGRQIDHVFVRGLEVVHAHAPQVAASDHNPVLATLRLRRR